MNWVENVSKSQVIFGQTRRDKEQNEEKDFAIVVVLVRINFAILAVYSEKDFAIM